VCNLTCDGCNRYNNYKFSGFWSWADAEPVLRAWAEKIDVRHPVILGGEPLLHPDIVPWINGLREIFPNYSGVQVQSNGTRIDCVRGLYEALDFQKTGNWIGISIHDPNDQEEIFNRIRNFLSRGVVVEQQNTKHPVMGSDHNFSNRPPDQLTEVHAWNSGTFVNSNIIELGDNRYTLYTSDPDRAHENCTFRRFKNYHMIRGKIYKCGPAALMPEFDQQYPFEISEEDRELLYSYNALSLDNYDSIGAEWLANIDNVIPQCKFCPETYTYKPITFSDRKKPWKKEPKLL
jgi:hypothetical protein